MVGKVILVISTNCEEANVWITYCWFIEYDSIKYKSLNFSFSFWMLNWHNDY